MKFNLKDLQSHLAGEVLDSPETLDYFSTDGSVFTIRPKAVVYPRNTADVRHTVTYLSSLATAGHPVGLIARGKGTDQGGGAVGDGVMVVMPTHMNKLRHLTKDTVTVQPGMIYGALQQVLHSHGRYLPPYPSSMEFCTIGGAVANNSCGEKTLKYGSTADYVKSLKVVLADGSKIETARLSARKLQRKKGQKDLEGMIYRQLDSLIEDNAKLIKEHRLNVTKNAAGYALGRVKRPDGSFDLSQIIVGSQGTLGVVTEITLKTLPFNPKTSLIVGHFDSIEKAGAAVIKLETLKPSAIEVVDYYLLDFLRRNKPAQIEGLVPDELPKITLLIEFDDVSQLKQTLKTSQTKRILKRLKAKYTATTNPLEQEKLWRIRRSAAAVIWMNHGTKKALPIIEDGVVPIDKLPEFLKSAYALLKKYNLEIAVWGHAGNANFHMQPFMDLGKKADRETVFKLTEEFYNMVIKMGGSTCGEHNDGLLRAPFLEKLYGKEMYGLFRQVKTIFDPQNIMNPGKKIDVTIENTRGLLRQEYSMKHLYDHMPSN